MTQVTRQAAEALMEVLAVEVRKTCPVCSDYQNHCDLCREHFGDIIEVKPIMLTDVLENLQQRRLSNAGEVFGELVYDWEQVGFTKPLQTILQEADIEHVCTGECDEFTDVHMANNRAKLVGPHAKIFEYLSSLFPET